MELRLAATTEVFLCEVNLAAPTLETVHMSDSSTEGFCLMYGRFGQTKSGRRTSSRSVGGF